MAISQTLQRLGRNGKFQAAKRIFDDGEHRASKRSALLVLQSQLCIGQVEVAQPEYGGQ